MNLNFDQVLHNFDGEEVADVESESRTLARAAEILLAAKRDDLAEAVLGVAKGMDNKFRAMTLRKACIVAIGAGVQEEKTPEKLMDYFDLGNKLKPGGEIEITNEEAASLKKLVARTFTSPMVAGQVCKMLNGATP